MIITANQLIEMVRAYAVEVNRHKPIEVVSHISDYVVHKISNLCHVEQKEEYNTDEFAFRIDDQVKFLYKYCIESYKSHVQLHN